LDLSCDLCIHANIHQVALGGFHFVTEIDLGKRR
jgi:hypothetical protein